MTRVTGRCYDCDEFFCEPGYAALVKAFQDHAREHHPRRWLRT